MSAYSLCYSWYWCYCNPLGESLCVLLDDKVNWKTHIHYISCKLPIGISVISKLKRLSNDDSLVTLYHSFIHSYICYRNHVALRWRQNGRDSVSNHQPRHCLLSLLFGRRSKKTSKLRVTGLCVGTSPGPVNSPHKGPVTRKIFPFDDVIMGEAHSVKPIKAKYSTKTNPSNYFWNDTNRTLRPNVWGIGLHQINWF